MRDYGKLLWAVVGGVVYTLYTIIDDGLTPAEWVGVVLAAVNAVVVWMAPDTTIAKWVKSAAGGLLAAVILAETAIIDGFTEKELLEMLIAGLTGAGIILDPRRPVHTITHVALPRAA